jgi:hypothetical protein
MKLDGRYTSVTNVITRIEVPSSTADLFRMSIWFDSCDEVCWFFKLIVSETYRHSW